MNVNIRFKGFDASDKLKDYIENRSKKLSKFVPPTTTLHVTLKDDKVRKIAELNLRHKGAEYIAKQNSDNMFTSIDEAVDKLVRQLSRAKSKKITRTSAKEIIPEPEIEF